jgi:hypothetical protein
MTTHVVILNVDKAFMGFLHAGDLIAAESLLVAPRLVAPAITAGAES